MTDAAPKIQPLDLPDFGGKRTQMVRMTEAEYTEWMARKEKCFWLNVYADQTCGSGYASQKEADDCGKAVGGRIAFLQVFPDREPGNRVVEVVSE